VTLIASAGDSLYSSLFTAHAVSVKFLDQQQDMGAKMAAKKSSPRAKRLPPLTEIQQQVMAYVLTSIALQHYDECCSVDRIAAELERHSDRFMPTLRKLEAKGYVTIEGETYPLIYPTVEALRQQDRRLTKAQARGIVKKLKG
jgi:hypothetical protein